MAYITNPYAPKARRLAVNLLRREGLSYAEVARRVGVHRSTIMRWNRLASKHSGEHIPTLPSRPKRHPNQLPDPTVERVIAERRRIGRSAPYIHARMKYLGYQISLSSVERILRRSGLTRKKKQARYPNTIKRPPVTRPGDLVQVDTIHYQRADGSRFYIYVMIDVYSRGAYAEYATRIGAKESFAFVVRGIQNFNFPVSLFQADNGPEFSRTFQRLIEQHGIHVRHSRARKPNDNAHIERFNRTLQEECFDRKLPDIRRIEKQLSDYLYFYNHVRGHFGLNLDLPANAVIKALLQRC